MPLGRRDVINPDIVIKPLNGGFLLQPLSSVAKEYVWRRWEEDAVILRRGEILDVLVSLYFTNLTLTYERYGGVPWS